MSVVAIIEDTEELGKIIAWARQQEKEPILSVCARSPPKLALVSVIPKIEVYAEQAIIPKSGREAHRKTFVVRLRPITQKARYWQQKQA